MKNKKWEENPPSVDSIIMLFKKLCAVNVCRLGFNTEDEAFYFPPKKFQRGLYVHRGKMSRALAGRS